MWSAWMIHDCLSHCISTEDLIYNIEEDYIAMLLPGLLINALRGDDVYSRFQVISVISANTAYCPSIFCLS